MERLHEEAGSAIRRWPLTPGYILRPDGIPLSESATEQAYEIFHGIVDEVQFLAKHHHNTPKVGYFSICGQLCNCEVVMATLKAIHDSLNLWPNKLEMK